MKKFTMVFLAGFVLLALSSPLYGQYLTEDFESAFVGDPGAPPGWVQTRVVLIGDGIPEPISTHGEKDWERNVWTGSAWTLVPSSPGTQPQGAQSGTGVLWMNDWFFGSTTSAFGSRRLESPTMNLATSTSPYVRFYYFCAYVSDRLLLRIDASSDGGTTWNTIMFIPPNAAITGTMAATTPWQRVNVLIPPAYRTANAKIGITMTNTWGTQNLWIDNLTVEEFTPTTVTSNASGNWDAAATWAGGVVPTADNHVVIASGHAVVCNVNMARVQNLTIEGTLGYSTTATQVVHAAGNIVVNPGGTLNAFNGTSGRKVYVGGNFTNNGTADFSKADANLIWVGGAPASFGGSGTFINGYLREVWHANSGGVTYNSPAVFAAGVSLLLGPVNPNGNMTLGDAAVATTQTIERGRGSFTAAPIFAAGVTRSVTYSIPHSTTGIALGLPQLTLSTGAEIEDIGGTRTVTGTLTVNTHNNVALSTPVTVGTSTTGALTLTRGIIITTPSNLLTLSSFIAGPSGTAPSTATPPTTHGSYISGPLRINFPTTGTTARNFALGVGTAFNGPTPSSNVLKTVNVAAGATAWAGQTITVSIEPPASGSVNPPLTATMGLGTYRLNLNGGPDLSPAATVTIRGRNSTFGNSDNMVGFQQDLRVAQASAVSGPWTERSVASGTGAFADNTDYPRTTATAAPGPIAPLATNGEYFTLATTAANMVYDSSNTYHPTLDPVPPGSSNQVILGIRVYTSGALSPLALTQLTLNTNGTTNAADIANAKVFYTGTSSTFSTANQFGSTVSSPSGTFAVNGSQTLASGVNYFWLTYDIASGATLDNYVDAECPAMVVGGTSQTPTITAPAGARQIKHQVIVGTGTLTQRQPLGMWYGFERSAALYTSSELGFSGTITVIGWYVSSLSSPAYGPMKIYLKTTTASTLTAMTWADMIAGATLVFDGTMPTLTAGQWNTIAITPFDYTADNLLVLVETNYGGTGGETSTAKAIRYTSATSRHQTWNTDNSPPTGDGSVGSNRPNVLIEYAPLSPMQYVSSTTTQNTAPVLAGSTNQQVIGVQIVTSGSLSPLSVTQFNLNTNGTTNTADISNAKIFYTGTSNTFATTTQFGSTVASPSGSFNITGSQALASGTNYFWLTYDISSGATVGNLVDAECPSLIVDAVTRIPTVTAPAGAREIIAPLSGTYTVGTGGNFATLSDAFAVVAIAGLGGNVTFNIISDIVEPGTAVLAQWTEVGAGGYTLTIQPSGAPRTISGNIAGAIIKLNGADRVTIDGRISGSGRNLTIHNTSTSTSSAVVWIASASATDSANFNTIRNCNIKGNSSTTTLMGIFMGGTASISTTGSALSGNSNNVIRENQVENAQYGIFIRGTSTSRLGHNNEIVGNLVGTALTLGQTEDDIEGGLGLNGITAQFQANVLIHGNDVQSIVHTTTSSNMTGINLEDSKSSTVSSNLVHGMSYTGTSTPKMYGITTSTSTFNTSGNPSANTYVNNAIFDLVNTATSTFWNTSGINNNGGYGDKYYFNSVYLSGQMSGGGGTGGSACFSNGNGITSTSADAIDVRNNAFYMNGSSTAAASLYAHYTTRTSYSASTLNYNDLLSVASGSATAHIGRFNNANHTSFSAWQSAVGQEANSISLDPLFNSATNLRPALGSPLLLAGTPIAGITTDLLGVTRNVTQPTIGAYEQAGDFSPPVITYTPLGHTSSTANRTLVTTITDPSGVATGGNAPRIYYRKGSVGSYVFANATSVVGSEYTFTIDNASIGGVTEGDTVQYYVAAQDVPGNAATNPAGGAGSSPPGTTPPPLPNSYRIVGPPLAGDYTVGVAMFNRVTGRSLTLEKRSRVVEREVFVDAPASEDRSEVRDETHKNQEATHRVEDVRMGRQTAVVQVEEEYYVLMENGLPYEGPVFIGRDALRGVGIDGTEGVYTTITAAVADLMLRGVSAAVRFLLTDPSYTEPSYPITIGEFAGASATNTVTIRPNTGVTTTITGSSTASIFKINGADYVILDGSNSGGTDRNMTITNTNTSTSSAVVWIASVSSTNGANNNTVKNCIITGNSPTTTFLGIVTSGAALGSVAETQNNNTTIRNNLIMRAQYGIGTVGPAGNETGLLITENIIGSTAAADKIGFNGIAVFQQAGAEVSKNTIMGVVTATTSTTSGIRVAGTADGILINANRISDVKNTNTGGWGSNGIQLSSSVTTANVTVANNFVWDVASYGYAGGGLADNGYGIVASAGGGYNVYHNSVHLMTDQTAVGGRPAAFNVTSDVTAVGALNVRNNIFANSQTVGTDRYAVYVGAASGVFANIDFNDYYTLGPNLGFLVTNRATLTDWQAATGQDMSSVSVNPNFTSPTDLHIPYGTTTQLESGGAIITGIAADIDGDPRYPNSGYPDHPSSPATAPDIGADEFAGIGIDLIPPAIGYTPLTNTSSTANRTLVATIWDANGVATGANAPRIYYRKGTSGTFVFANATSVVGNDYTFTIDNSVIGGVAGGDLVQYYVAAQDIPGNVSTNPSGGSGSNPPGTTPPPVPNSYTILLVVSTFPYLEDFEDPAALRGDAGTLLKDGTAGTTDGVVGRGGPQPVPQTGGLGWTTGIVTGTVNNWVRGTPAKTQIASAHSGVKAYVTLETGTYSNNHNAFIQSPIFNFSALTADPTLEFWHNFLTEANYDGAVVEYSTDGGSTWRRVDSTLGTGGNFTTTNSFNWYNNNSTSGPLPPPKFSGSSTAYTGHASGWIKSTTVLVGLGGLSDVRLRWRFQTDGSVINEGWAIDDVAIIPATVNVVVPFATGWNMVSNPVTRAALTDSVHHLFPASSFSHAFRYVPGTGYQQTFTMPNKEGFWAKFPSAGTSNIEGGLRSSDLIPVVAGWNLVGSISNPVDTSAITSTPAGLKGSAWFGYAAGYVPVTQILPGRGYWIKSNGVGSFNFTSSSAAGKQAVRTNPLEALHTLTITDARGGAQTLYFGAPVEGLNVAWYELPPLPPSEVFDARFEAEDGGFLVQTHDGAAGEFPIAIQSSAYPLTISWELRGTSGEVGYVLSDPFGGEIFGVQTLAGSGSVVVENSSLNRLMLKVTGVEALPEEYALWQNYPNPFNPTTNIKFALPVESKVSVDVYNILGQRVATLVNEVLPAGYHTMEWNGTNDAGAGLASGVYFMHMSAEGANGKKFSEVRKLMLLK